MGRQYALQLNGGFHAGPLFVIEKRRRARYRGSGGAEVWAKYSRARPSWANNKAISSFWEKSKVMTASTGIQHSVDHIVPLIHPLVCGLHCEDNLEVIPLKDNIAKCNNWWPDMWGIQLELI